MSKFLIDEDVNQRAIRSIPADRKGLDFKFPEQGSYKGAVDATVRKIAIAEERTLVSQERDFGKYQLRPEDLPHGAVWLRPVRISQRKVGDLLTGLCDVLQREFPENPYEFRGKILEVFPDRIVIHALGGITTPYAVRPDSPHRSGEE